METIFEKKYLWDEFIDSIESTSINYITYTSNEERADSTLRIKILEKKRNVNNYKIEYNYENDSIIDNDIEYDLTSEIDSFIENINSTIPLIIDITAMNIRVLGTILNSLKNKQFLYVFCVYCEPFRYKKTEHKSEEDCFSAAFELYKKFKGIKPIPGFLRGNEDNLEERWVVFLGFEGKRIIQIRDDYEFNSSKIIPVVTLPGFNPGWHNYAIYSNIDALKDSDKIEYIAADSYLDAYSFLSNIKDIYSGHYIRIVPLGTKVNALGALLFSLNNKKDVEILYDNPRDENASEGGIGNTYVYDISELVYREK